MMMHIDPLCPGDRVLCAVSGGADSMYLLARMQQLSAEHGFSVLCAHYNHRQRGAESDRDERFVRDYCAQHEIPCFVGTYAGERRDEASLRFARYAFLREISAAQGCRCIATAHTADDQLETMLLRLARGTGLSGLGGMEPVSGDLLRPMLDLPRAEVERWLTEHGVPHVEDSSNASDVYARNRLRHEALPALRAVNARAAGHAAETASRLREDEAYLSDCAARFLAQQTGDAISAEALSSLPRPIRARVFRLLCGAALEGKHIEALHAFCNGTEAAALDLPGLKVTREQGMLRFGADAPPPLPVLELSPGEKHMLPAQQLCVTAEKTIAHNEIHKPLTVYYFQSDAIRGKLLLTCRRPGDAIRLVGRGCTKRVSDLLAEGGVPASRRDQIPVLRDDAGVLAVHGFGMDERAAAKPGEEAICVAIHDGTEKDR